MPCIDVPYIRNAKARCVAISLLMLIQVTAAIRNPGEFRLPEVKSTTGWSPPELREAYPPDARARDKEILNRARESKLRANQNLDLDAMAWVRGTTIVD